jgi:hypothetical protein
VLSVAYLMVVLDVSIVNVALPSIQKSLDFSTSGGDISSALGSGTTRRQPLPQDLALRTEAHIAPRTT